MRHHCRRRNRGSHFNTLPPWLSVNNHSVGTPYSPHIAKLKEMHRSIRPQGSSTNDVTRFGRKIDSPSPLYHMWSQSQISEPPAKMTLQAYELPLPQKAIPHSLHSRCVQWSPLSCIAKKPTCSHFPGLTGLAGLMFVHCSVTTKHHQQENVIRKQWENAKFQQILKIKIHDFSLGRDLTWIS